MAKLTEFRPSSELAHINILDFFFAPDGKKYLLVERDPWVAKALQWRWYDTYIFLAVHWLKSKLSRGEKKNETDPVILEDETQ